MQMRRLGRTDLTIAPMACHRNSAACRPEERARTPCVSAREAHRFALGDSRPCHRNPGVSP